MELISQTIAVFVVLALLAGALWWLRRKGFASFSVAGRTKSGKRMEVVERLQLTPQHSLHLVRLGETGILLSIFPNGCAVIEKLAALPPAPEKLG